MPSIAGTTSSVVAYGGFLLGEQDGLADSKQWNKGRLEFLAANFSIAVGGFAILGNHPRVHVRIALIR